MTIISNEMKGSIINLNLFINEDNCKAISGLFGALLGEIFLYFIFGRSYCVSEECLPLLQFDCNLHLVLK